MSTRPFVREPLPLDVIQAWEPLDRPHCSDCRYAKITGNPDRPVAYCAMGEGQEIDLWRLIRRLRPLGFRSAEKCPHFSSMSNEVAP